MTTPDSTPERGEQKTRCDECGGQLRHGAVHVQRIGSEPGMIRQVCADCYPVWFVRFAPAATQEPIDG